MFKFDYFTHSLYVILYVATSSNRWLVNRKGTKILINLVRDYSTNNRVIHLVNSYGLSFVKLIGSVKYNKCIIKISLGQINMFINIKRLGRLK